MTMQPKLALAAMLVIGVVACETPPPPAAPPAAGTANSAEIAGSEPVPELGGECTNREGNFTVRYPAAWQTNRGDVVGPCSIFDPDPIEIPVDSEFPIEFAVMMNVERAPFASLTGEMLGRRDISKEATDVDGRQAVRIESESTGEGLYDAGIRSYGYFVDLGETTMIATTWDAGSLPFEQKRRILDAMMATVELETEGRQ
jgi:hypothetical protein